MDAAWRSVTRKVTENRLNVEWKRQARFVKPTEARKEAAAETENRLARRAFKAKLRWIFRRKARCVGSEVGQGRLACAGPLIRTGGDVANGPGAADGVPVGGGRRAHASPHVGVGCARGPQEPVQSPLSLSRAGAAEPD